MSAWLTEFAPFSPVHAAVVAVATLVTIVAVRRRRRLAGTPAAEQLDALLAVIGIANWLAYQGYGAFRVASAWGTPEAGKYTIEYALPLQVCDIASLLAPLMWLTNRRLLSVLVYFWGLGLSSQAFLTPTVRSGPATAEFWFFFIAHWMIVGGALYEVFGRGFRPTWRDWRMAVGLSLVYLAVILPIDLALSYNFGYVGRPREGAPRTMADALGPWPLRIVWMALLGVTAMTLTMVPWLVMSRRERASLPEPVAR
jgi:hypothetical integral membrane protein (TIGR02206 family)